MAQLWAEPLRAEVVTTGATGGAATTGVGAGESGEDDVATGGVLPASASIAAAVAGSRLPLMFRF
jgi:hypothetical protein